MKNKQQKKRINSEKIMEKNHNDFWKEIEEGIKFYDRFNPSEKFTNARNELIKNMVEKLGIQDDIESLAELEKHEKNRIKELYFELGVHNRSQL